MAEPLRPLPDADPADDVLVIAGESFRSRLILGTGGAPNLDELERALAPGERVEVLSIAQGG